MTTERRHFRRLSAPVFWRLTGFRGARRPVDVSLGGMRMYCDDALDVGKVLELELLAADDDEPIEFLARVVWVDALPEGGPARFDVGLAFIELPDGARHRLAGLLSTD